MSCWCWPSLPLVLMVTAPRAGLPTAAQVSATLLRHPLRRGRRGRARPADPRRRASSGSTPTRCLAEWTTGRLVERSRDGRTTVARWTLVPAPVGTPAGRSGAAAAAGRWRLLLGPARRPRRGPGRSSRPPPPWPARSPRTSSPLRWASTPAGPSGPGSSSPAYVRYAPGDRQRDVDWRTSARHGELFVRQYAEERAFDLVLVLDTARRRRRGRPLEPRPDGPRRDRAGPELPARARPGRRGHLRRPAALARARDRPPSAVPGLRGAHVGAPGRVRAGRRERRVRPRPRCRAGCCRGARSSPC